MTIDPALLAILACPRCHAPLQPVDGSDELACTGGDCALVFPVRDDIPVLLLDEARSPESHRA